MGNEPREEAARRRPGVWPCRLAIWAGPSGAPLLGSPACARPSFPRLIECPSPAKSLVMSSPHVGCTSHQLRDTIGLALSAVQSGSTDALKRRLEAHPGGPRSRAFSWSSSCCAGASVGVARPDRGRGALLPIQPRSGAHGARDVGCPGRPDLLRFARRGGQSQAPAARRGCWRRTGREKRVASRVGRAKRA